MKTENRLKLAGKELIKGNIGNAFKSLTSSHNILPDSYRGGGFWMFNQPPGGIDVHFDYTDILSALRAYTRCPAVAAVINRKTQAYVNGKTWILNKNGKAKGKEATGEIASKIRTLINKPNPIQSWKQFEGQQYIYQQVGGYVVVLPLKPVGFGNIEAKSMWNVPPWMLEIVEKKKVDLTAVKSVKDLIESVTLVWKNTRTPLPLDDIYIFKDFTPSIDSLVFPESRIKVLKQPINNIIGALESRAVLIESRGPMYVISSNESDESGNIAIASAEKEELLNEFKARYGLTRKQSTAIITNSNIKVSSVGFPTKDLLLFEEIEDDTMQICDGYNYPYRLLSSSKVNSLGGSDIKAYKSLLYQDAILPEAESMYEQWNQFFETDKYGLIIDKDFTHVSALQEDQDKQANARLKRNQAALIEFQNNLLTLNRWNELNGEDPVEGEIGTMYYYQLMEKGIQFGKAAPVSVSVENQNNNANNENEE